MGSLLPAGSRQQYGSSERGQAEGSHNTGWATASPTGLSPTAPGPGKIPHGLSGKSKAIIWQILRTSQEQDQKHTHLQHNSGPEQNPECSLHRAPAVVSRGGSMWGECQVAEVEGCPGKVGPR